MAGRSKVRIKRVRDPREEADGLRVLVDGLWPRGVTKEQAAVDVWLKEIAPSAGLRKWFHHEAGGWDEFRRRYLAELESNGEAVARLAELVRAGPVTLLYDARDADHNQAVVLRDYLADTSGRA